MNWNGLKLYVSGEPVPIRPHYYEEPFPTGLDIRIEYDPTNPNGLNSAVSDLMHRIFAREDIILTKEVADNITANDQESFPNQRELFYKKRYLGLLYTTSDMFSHFINFNSEMHYSDEIT